MRTLGISAFYHDSAAALVEDGRIVAAAQEERFNRQKHYAGFPEQAVAYCLGVAGCDLDSVDRIAFYDKPLIKFERLLETYVAFAPRGFRSFAMAMPVSTPPNAIVFGTGQIPVSEMIRVGGLISIVSVLILLVGYRFIVPLIF